MTYVDAPAAAPPRAERLSARARFGVAVAALSTFTVVTAEMLPVGLLTPIGESLGITEGLAGLTLTITGLVAMSAPLLVSVFGRMDRRVMLVVLTTLLGLADLLAAWSPNFGVMIIARILIGIGMGGVWTIAGTLAVRLVPPHAVATANSFIFGGIAVASVLSIPAGAYIGALAGWRVAFVVAGGLAIVVAIAQLLVLPRLPAQRMASLAELPRLLLNPRVRTVMIIVVFLVAGHFAAYTYVRPALEHLSGASAGTVGTLLLAYGIAGVAGTFVAGAITARSPRKAVLAIGSALAAAVLLLAVAGGSLWTAAIFMVIWGLAYGGVSVSTQTWTLASAPAARESAAALLTAVFNGSIALGALAGGRAADGLGVTAALWLGCALAIVAVLAAVFGQAPANGRLSDHPGD